MPYGIGPKTIGIGPKKCVIGLKTESLLASPYWPVRITTTAQRNFRRITLGLYWNVPCGDTSSGTLIAVCVCVCVCVSADISLYCGLS